MKSKTLLAAFLFFTSTAFAQSYGKGVFKLQRLDAKTYFIRFSNVTYNIRNCVDTDLTGIITQTSGTTFTGYLLGDDSNPSTIEKSTLNDVDMIKITLYKDKIKVETTIDRMECAPTGFFKKDTQL